MGTLEIESGVFVMEGLKIQKIDVLFNYAKGVDEQAVDELYMRLTKTWDIYDAKEVLHDMINSQTYETINACIDEFAYGYVKKIGDIFRKMYNEDCLEFRLTYVGDGNICLELNYSDGHIKRTSGFIIDLFYFEFNDMVDDKYVKTADEWMDEFKTHVRNVVHALGFNLNNYINNTEEK